MSGVVCVDSARYPTVPIIHRMVYEPALIETVESIT
jgi:hypothetical protein